MYDKKNSLLTIIIPCYNAEKYFERCVASLEGIDKKLVKILFVNDGSVDKTGFMIESWLKTHSNACVVEKENGGYSSAINEGLNHCDSEYVMFLGIDDELVSNGINKICEHLHSNKPDILAFSTQKFYDDLNKSSISGELDFYTDYENPGIYEMDLSTLYNKNGHDSLILFTRDTSRCFSMKCVNAIRYLGKRGISADGCFSIMVSSNAKKFEFVDEVCYRWHLHKDSVSGRKKTKETLEEELSVWDNFFLWVSESFPLEILPDPVLNYLLEYKKIIDQASGEDSKELVKWHENKYRFYRKKIFANYSISTKYRIKIQFSLIYKLYTRIRFGNA